MLRGLNLGHRPILDCENFVRLPFTPPLDRLFGPTNKMLETQLAQLAALDAAAENGKIPGQPVSSCENVSVV